ncbi:NEDD4-binding protein 2-like 2 [Spea bombifrons]|uniref:NEDD4-binding protein 2-like 2 n=1 Tax=Spea bombifrons TaxID=233779 RepID=UPI00234A45D6|nr:NEDD4-binding protein 2-like 2 [Spea bombifrons]
MTIWGLDLCASLEMPHAENITSQCDRDSSEPCLKKLRTDDNAHRPGESNAAHALTEGSVTQSQEQCFFGAAKYEPDHGNVLGIALNKDYRTGYGKSLPSSGVGSDHEPKKCKYQSQNQSDSRGNCQNPSKCVFPKVGETKDCSSAACDGEFSETAFIGPLFPPPPKGPNVTGRSNSDGKQSPGASCPCYNITTVELGKNQSRSKHANGLDYELRQFYKELHVLEGETYNETVSFKENEHSVSIQEPVSENGPRNRAPASQVECDATQRNNQAFHARPANWGGPNVTYRPNSHLSNTVPPRFLGPPPPLFFIRYGPPPPVCLPSYFPDKNINPYEPYPQSHNHSGYGVGFQRPNIQEKSNNVCIPKNSGYNDQGSRSRRLLPEDDYRLRQEPRTEETLGHKEPHLPHNPGILPQQCHVQYGDNNNKPSNSKRLILLRGVPGSGKSTLACNLLELHPDGIVFSTDDYFCQREGYTYNVKLLGDAHDWNQDRAKRAMDDGRSPIIIDNTNIQAWEMKPYVQMALERDYIVEFLEPDTWWKLDPLELEKRNTHGVPREKISQMLDRYEYDVTVPVVLNSVEPPRRRLQRPPPQPRQRWGGSVDFSHHSSAFHNR